MSEAVLSSSLLRLFLFSDNFLFHFSIFLWFLFFFFFFKLNKSLCFRANEIA